MIKKAYHIIVMLILILGTTGITISQHYCHGKFVSSGLYSNAKSCCGTSCGACENKTTIHRVNDNFISSAYALEQAKEIQIFTFDFWADNPQRQEFDIIGTTYYIYQKAPPPGYSSKPEYLKVFRC